MILELSLSLALLLSLVIIQAKPVLLLMWIIAVFLAYAYSAPPLRFKSRSFIAVITLMTVLSILPVTFVTYVFTTTLDSSFCLFLSGQALTVYAVIIPAEIRDYFGDKAKGIVTMTVQIGLVNASRFGITLLSLGGILCGTGFVLKLVQNQLAILSVFLVLMAITYLYVLRAYWKLYKLSKKLTSAEEQNKTEQAIVELAARNPRWITLITQIIVIMCIVLLASKL